MALGVGSDKMLFQGRGFVLGCGVRIILARVAPWIFIFHSSPDILPKIGPMKEETCLTC